MWHQPLNPFHNIALSALAAAIPIAVLFALLISRKVGLHIAAVLTLVTAFIVAVAVYHMPLRLGFESVVYGILNGLFPIGWIVFAAVFSVQP